MRRLLMLTCACFAAAALGVTKGYTSSITLPHVRVVDLPEADVNISAGQSEYATGISAASNSHDICIYDNDPGSGYNISISGDYGTSGEGLELLLDGAVESDPAARIKYSVRFEPNGGSPVTLDSINLSEDITGYTIGSDLDCTDIANFSHYSIIVTANELQQKVAGTYKGDLNFDISDI